VTDTALCDIIGKNRHRLMGGWASTAQCQRLAKPGGDHLASRCHTLLVNFLSKIGVLRKFPETSRGNAMSEKKRALKPPPKAVLRELADLVQVPEVERNFYYDEIRKNVRETCELKKLSDLLAKEKSEELHRSALSLQEALWGLTQREARLIDKMLNSKEAFIFNKISSHGTDGSSHGTDGSSHGTDGLREIGYQLALLFSMLPAESSPSRNTLRKANRRGQF
jgi:hypothetical protein